MYAAPTGPNYYGPPEYLLEDGRTCRNLLGDVDNITMYQRARGKPNLSAYSVDFWASELTTDCPPHLGYKFGSQVYTAQNPGRDGTYDQTDFALFKIDRNHYTLGIVLILEGKPQGYSKTELRRQALRDAKEIVDTYGYRILHIVTTIDTSFHAWKYEQNSTILDSLFGDTEESEETYLDASHPLASERWMHLMDSIRGNPPLITVHPSLVLSSSSAASGPSGATNTTSFPTSSIQFSRHSAYESASNAEGATEAGPSGATSTTYYPPSSVQFSQHTTYASDSAETSTNTHDYGEPDSASYQSDVSMGQSQTETAQVSPEDGLMLVELERISHRFGSDELVFVNRHGTKTSTKIEEWKRTRYAGQRAYKWKKSKNQVYYTTSLP